MNWRVLTTLKTEKASARQNEILTALLKNRGITTSSLRKKFFYPSDPMGMTLKEVGISSIGVNLALKRLVLAKEKGESVLVYGDYDADGICATAILWETLYGLGFDVLPYLPDRRAEGYGLNGASVARLKSDRPKLGLIVTVDQGIVAHRAVKDAKKLGVDVIISDHHQMKKTVPEAVAIVHTTDLSGAGVAWFLAREISRSFGRQKQAVAKRLELAAIGTVTDLLPMIGPSRSIVVFGLRRLAKTTRPGLKALIRAAGIEDRELGTYELGFLVGPRLNAAGRVGNPMNALRLLCSTDEERCGQLASRLEKTNGVRQQLMEELIEEARRIWLSQRQDEKLIFVTGQDWPEGVIGLAAARLTEEFYLPSVVVSISGKTARGSARSITGFDITASLREIDDYLIDAGGHSMAAGFTIEKKNIDHVRRKLIDLAEQQLDVTQLEKTLRLDLELKGADISLELYHQLEKFAPFGVGNPRPDFVIRGVKIVQSRQVGKSFEHLRLRVQVDGRSFEAIGFRLADRFSGFSVGQKVDLAFDLQLNEWQGSQRLQLRLKDIRL